MTQKANPAVVAVVVAVLIAIAGFAIGRGFQGGSNEQAFQASHQAIQKTTVEIPQAIGAAPGRTAPSQPQGGTINTPLMGPGGGMTGPGNGR